MKEIGKKEMIMLEREKVIFNSDRGYVDKFGNVIGFYRTKNKRYVEDKYANIAKRLSTV